LLSEPRSNAKYSSGVNAGSVSGSAIISRPFCISPRGQRNSSWILTAQGTNVQYAVGKRAGYGADVVEPEPIVPTNPLLTAPNVVLTPHVGSRTYESVERQAVMAVENMLRVLSGQTPHAQANTL
jgi:D-isomer specific 2-hydroxyacid dehydrogenase, NAD binding domain